MRFAVFCAFGAAWIFFLKLWLDGKAPLVIWVGLLAAFLTMAVAVILEPVTL